VNTSDVVGPQAKSTDIRIAYLLEELKASRKPSLGDYLLVLFMALCILGSAWFRGTQIFIGCAMVLALVLTLQGITESRMRHRTDLLLDLARELQKKVECNDNAP